MGVFGGYFMEIIYHFAVQFNANKIFNTVEAGYCIDPSVSNISTEGVNRKLK